MAKYVIPPAGKDIIFVKCWRCRTLYSPDHPENKTNEMYANGMRNVMYYDGDLNEFEPCPHCGYTKNGWNETISYLTYRIIAFFRGLRK